MRAIIADNDTLVQVERPVPEPGAGEIVIKIQAAGVNRPDILQRRGLYPPPPGACDVLGLEVAGDIVAVGQGVTQHNVGDCVTALVASGGYADYARAYADHALPIPSGLSWVEAAAIPEAYFTVWGTMFDRARLQAGEWVLVHGGTSGIGTTATLLAKAFGAHVIATAGSATKLEACLVIGADVAINYHEEDFVTATQAATGGRGANVILDMVGGEYVARNYAAAAEEGRIVQLSHFGGVKAEINLRLLMTKRLIHTGSTLRPRSRTEKAAIAERLHQHVWPLLEAGRCKPVIDSTFPLEEAAAAHARMESSAHIGKIVLTF